MDFLSGLAKGGESKPTSDEPDKQEKSSDYGVSAGVKVVAGATADALGAASDYGKLDDTKGVGKYVDQAEVYLRQYGTTTTTTTPTPTNTHDAENPSGGAAGDYIKKAKDFFNKPSDDGAGKK